MTLPQIRPISAGDEDLTLLAGLASPGTLGTDALDLPPAVSEIERRLVLTMLVQRWSQTIRRDTSDAAHLGDHAAAAGANTPAQAAHLAAELARLMDMVETENVPLDGLAGLVPDEYSEHWKDTIKFLEIITAFWPAYLEEKKLLSPAARRNRAILAEAERLARTPPSGPVIVAGVSGLGAGDGRADGRRRASAAGRHRAAGPRFASRRRKLGGDRRASGASAVRLCQAARRTRRRAARCAVASRCGARHRTCRARGAHHRGHAPIRHDGSLAAVHRGRRRRAPSKTLCRASA